MGHWTPTGVEPKDYDDDDDDVYVNDLHVYICIKQPLLFQINIYVMYLCMYVYPVQ